MELLVEMNGVEMGEAAVVGVLVIDVIVVAEVEVEVLVVFSLQGLGVSQKPSLHVKYRRDCVGE